MQHASHSKFITRQRKWKTNPSTAWVWERGPCSRVSGGHDKELTLYQVACRTTHTLPYRPLMWAWLSLTYQEVILYLSHNELLDGFWSSTLMMKHRDRSQSPKEHWQFSKEPKNSEDNYTGYFLAMFNEVLAGLERSKSIVHRELILPTCQTHFERLHRVREASTSTLTLASQLRKAQSWKFTQGQPSPFIGTGSKLQSLPCTSLPLLSIQGSHFI